MKSNAIELKFPDLGRLNLHIETLTDDATKDYVNNLLHGIKELKAANEVSPIPEYSAALTSANEQLKIICKGRNITDSQIAKRINRSTGWLSECSLSPEHGRARKVQTMQNRLYTVIQARKSALFALFASRKRSGVCG
jgi:hypothetical protein